MCLYVDDFEGVMLDSGQRTARKPHACGECGRTIDSGETYWFWTSVAYGDPPQTDKLCAHCNATLDLGCSFTGCPKAWYWGMIHSLDGEDGGFVGDILSHDITDEQRTAMLATIEGRRLKWRDQDNVLLPTPANPKSLATGSSTTERG